MSITVFEERHSKIEDRLLQSDLANSENLENNAGNEVKWADETKAVTYVERVLIKVPCVKYCNFP